MGWIMQLIYLTKVSLLVILFLLSTPVNSDNGLYLDIDLGANLSGMSNQWEGDYPTAFRLYYSWGDAPWYLPDRCGYAHLSNLLKGAPFNNEPETTLEQLYCGKTWKLL